MAGLFIYDRPHLGGDPQRISPVSAASDTASVVARAIAVMETNLEEPLAMGEICRQAHCHQRELERRFRSTLGAAPVSYYRYLRVAAARRMVIETDRRGAEIAVRTGFGSASALTRAFRKHYGDTPRGLRTTVRHY